MIDPYLMILAGALALYLGAEWLIRGSASLAMRMGVSAMIIGLTIVGYGTSFPELIVSLQATLMNRGEIALGNVIGSNICNIGLILGLFAVISPRPVPKKLLKFDIPILIGITLLLGLFIANRSLDRIEGVFLIGLLLAYTLWTLYFHKRTDTDEEKRQREMLPPPATSTKTDLGLILAGFAGLFIGSELFLKGAIHIAKDYGISDAVIGLSLVAIGTSLPELITTAVALFRKQGDIALGNIIGSNIYNILSIVGFCSLVGPIPLTGFHWIDYGILLGFSILLLIMMYTRLLLSRREGFILLLLFGGFYYYLLQHHPSYLIPPELNS